MNNASLLQWKLWWTLPYFTVASEEVAVGSNCELPVTPAAVLGCSKGNSAGAQFSYRTTVKRLMCLQLPESPKAFNGELSMS